MPLRANTRRWPRHQVDLPVSIVLNGTPRMVVPGRATEISEGGMALYAGMIHPKPGDLMEIDPGSILRTGHRHNSQSRMFLFRVGIPHSALD